MSSQNDVFFRLAIFFLLHLHPPHISMQVMARAENTVFLGVEVKDTKLNIFGVHALKAKDLWVAADSSVRIGPGFSVNAKLRTVS